VLELRPVLVHLTEAALLVVHKRIAGMARNRGLDLTKFTVYVTTAPVVRLDLDRDRTRRWRQPRGFGRRCSV
jgi:hypothetical protein